MRLNWLTVFSMLVVCVFLRLETDRSTSWSGSSKNVKNIFVVGETRIDFFCFLFTFQPWQATRDDKNIRAENWVLRIKQEISVQKKKDVDNIRQNQQRRDIGECDSAFSCRFHRSKHLHFYISWISIRVKLRPAGKLGGIKTIIKLRLSGPPCKNFEFLEPSLYFLCLCCCVSLL